MNEQAERARAGPPAHETVYRDLRDRVLFGALEPGQPVTIQGLITELGAGMTQVREALRRLTAEGALQAQGNRRIVVPVLDAAAVDELTEARLALEPLLAARAAPSVRPEDIRALRAVDAALDKAILCGDVPGYLRQNHRFHATLNALAEAPVLTSLVDGLWLRFGPSLRIVCGQVGTRALPDRHKDLLEALEQGDEKAASAAMAADVAQGMALIRGAL